ncbi:Hypp9049 [Branchiostoma lanceolatum]|uniref:Hypp9049 protein n=1 Tax=Branchiostoma lanceolatum TaxID=7740 RepID=A0A8J9ZD64_BRALA|nr:Hypp9049 [Branchiostoma lanceolatum]
MPRRGSLRDRRFNRTARRRYQLKPEPRHPFQIYLSNILSEWLTLNGIMAGTVLYCSLVAYVNVSSAPGSKTSDYFMIFILNVPYGMAFSTTWLIAWNMLMETVDSLLNILVISSDALLPEMPRFLRGVMKLILDVVLALVMMIYCVLQLVLLVRPNREKNEDQLLDDEEEEVDDSFEFENPKRFRSKRQRYPSKSNKSPKKQKQKGKALVEASKQHSKEHMWEESGPFWSFVDQKSETEILNFLNKLEDEKEFLAEKEKRGENLENLKLHAENQLYKNRLDVERDRLICTVCHEEERKLAIVPCMHFFMCKACWEKLSQIDKKCPYCDRKAEDVKEIFVV